MSRSGLPRPDRGPSGPGRDRGGGGNRSSGKRPGEGNAGDRPAPRRVDRCQHSDPRAGQSTDNGRTWEAIEAENAFTLGITRDGRLWLAGEDRESTQKKTGCPPDLPSPEPSIYKNGLLLESHDRGRTFREVPGSLTGYYEHRGTILWTGDNVVVVTHQAGNRSPSYGALFARISLDGGKTWADGTPSGTSRMNRSTRFELVPKPPGHSFTAPTLELSRGRFLTPYLHGSIAAGTATPGSAGVPPALPGSRHPMTSSRQGHKIAEAFWCRLSLKEVHLSSCPFVVHLH